MPMSPRLLRPRQNVHPEAADWANRVRTNGGTVSGSTLAAVGRFCRAIDAAGIRDRFYRLNLFCGNSDANLYAVRTPLYRGPSRTGTQYGGTTDTNTGNLFLDTDYAENNGLLGNGSTKWLNTGFNANAAGLTGNSLHFSSVWPQYTHPASSSYIAVSIVNSSVNSRFWLLPQSFSGATRVETFLGASGVNSTAKTIAATNGATMPGGLWVTSRTSTISLRLYNGATEEASYEGLLGDTSMPTTDMSVFVRWSGSATFGFFGTRMRAYSVGLGLTGQHVIDFNNAMTTVQTALGRT